MLALDHLHQLHHQRGVKVVQVGKTAGIYHIACEHGRRHTAGVGGDDGILTHQSADLLEDSGLDILALDDGLDHQVGILHSLFQGGADGKAAADTGNLFLGHTALGDTACQVVILPLCHILQNSGVGIENSHFKGINGGVQRDLTTHQAAADNTYLLDLHSLSLSSSDRRRP